MLKIDKSSIKKNLPIRKKPLSGSLNRSLRTIALKLKKAPKKGKAKRNFSMRSYFSKYIVRKKRKYNRTRKPIPGKAMFYSLVSQTYIERQEQKKEQTLESLYKLKRIPLRSRPPRKRWSKWLYRKILRRVLRRPIFDFTYGLITMRHAKRNFFISVHKYLHHSMTHDPHIRLTRGKSRRKDILNKQKKKKRNRRPDLKGKKFAYRVLFKSSVGLTGYRGPKRSSNLGKQRVIRACSNFLRKKTFTAIDIRFPRKITKYYSFLFRTLLRTKFWVRRIIFSKYRSHGFFRLRKAKRK